MPRGDSTGPPRGGGASNRRGIDRGGRDSGSIGDNRSGAGPRGECYCPNCGARVPHKAGIPCIDINCPYCGICMARV